MNLESKLTDDQKVEMANLQVRYTEARDLLSKTANQSRTFILHEPYQDAYNEAVDNWLYVYQEVKQFQEYTGIFSS